MRERYINPFTDFGFKKIFGEEANTDLLIDFINTLLPEAAPVISLRFLKNEHLGATPTDRKAIFDLYCQNERGEKFGVALRNAPHKYFKDDWFPPLPQLSEETHLQKIYVIVIMDFVRGRREIASNRLCHDLPATPCFVYLEIPKFDKAEAELTTHYDKWLYVLKNLVYLQEQPLNLSEPVFQKVFQTAEIALYSADERRDYFQSAKAWRDIKNCLATAFEEGLRQGYRQAG